VEAWVGVQPPDNDSSRFRIAALVGIELVALAVLAYIIYRLA
jgi:hypothetical protein